jgi:hypothetical protein
MVGPCRDSPPSLQFGFELVINGRNVNGIKEYIGDVFGEWLTLETDTTAAYIAIEMGA